MCTYTLVLIKMEGYILSHRFKLCDIINSLVAARQNVPITSILTDFALASWEDFDVGLSLIGSEEMIWITYFDNSKTEISQDASMIVPWKIHSLKR